MAYARVRSRRDLVWFAAIVLLAGGARSESQQLSPSATPSPTPLPEFEIYLAPVTGSGNSLKVGTPKNISNHPGYDNQPKFDADDRSIVFTRGDSATRTDIYRYDLATSALSPVKETAESEYSATPMP